MRVMAVTVGYQPTTPMLVFHANDNDKDNDNADNLMIMIMPPNATAKCYAVTGRSLKAVQICQKYYARPWA